MDSTTPTLDELNHLKNLLCDTAKKQTIWDSFFDRHIVLSEVDLEKLKENYVHTACKELRQMG